MIWLTGGWLQGNAAHVVAEPANLMGSIQFNRSASCPVRPWFSSFPFLLSFFFRNRYYDWADSLGACTFFNFVS
jgi:hypothetical protein